LFREMMIVLTGVQCVTIFNVPDNQVWRCNVFVAFTLAQNATC